MCANLLGQVFITSPSRYYAITSYFELVTCLEQSPISNLPSTTPRRWFARTLEADKENVKT